MKTIFIPALLLVLIIPCITAAAEEGPRITVNLSEQEIPFGDDVTISGTSNGFNISLFMTGPGLDPEGVMLFNTTKPATTKGHIMVSPVNNTWSRVWHTRGIRGPLPSGNYTIYAWIGPFDTGQLKTCDRCKCVTSDVTLTVPGGTGSLPAGTTPVAVVPASSGSTTPPATTPAPAGTPSPTPSHPAPSLYLVPGIAAGIALAIRMCGKR